MSILKSDFLFLRSFPYRFSRPFIFTNFTFFQISSYRNLLTPTSGTSFFSTHSSIRSISRILVFSYQLPIIVFIIHYSTSIHIATLLAVIVCRRKHSSNFIRPHVACASLFYYFEEISLCYYAHKFFVLNHR